VYLLIKVGELINTYTCIYTVVGIDLLKQCSNLSVVELITPSNPATSFRIFHWQSWDMHKL